MISATLEGDINTIDEFEAVSNVMFGKVKAFIDSKISETTVEVIQGAFPGAQASGPFNPPQAAPAGKCYKCGSEMKVSQKSGKPYCAALCWKKNQTDIPY